MTGKSHTDPEATPFALDVMKHMNEACNKWKEETNIAFSIYGSPIESTTYKFAKCLQKRFGVIPGITDKSYITNSYHVFVGEEIDAFAKLKFESQFQALSTGGAISYVEVPDMKDNIPAVLQVIRFIYENIMYAELNTKSDYCQECGFDGDPGCDRRGRKARVGMSSLWQPEPGYAECCKTYLRIYRNSVLESGEEPRKSRSEFFICRSRIKVLRLNKGDVRVCADRSGHFLV